jgi:hypothetical protein
MLVHSVLVNLLCLIKQLSTASREWVSGGIEMSVQCQIYLRGKEPSGG